MDTNMFDAVTRQSAAVSRRGSLRILGGAALTGAFAAPTVASAKKAGKKADQRCKRQQGQCLAFIETFCEPKENPGVCEAFLGQCCDEFARCEAGKGIQCLFAVTTTG